MKIEIKDHTSGVLYKQKSKENNSIIEQPKITQLTTPDSAENNNTEEIAKRDYVKVTFKPDFAKFKLMVWTKITSLFL